MSEANTRRIADRSTGSSTVPTAGLLHSPAVASRASTVSVTLTEQTTHEETSVAQSAVLHLTLQPRAAVTWDDSVVDNEGMGRKSSKRCCIFHKQRNFGESSTDSSDDNNNGNDDDSDGNANDNDAPRIARPKQGRTRKVPDYQRFHA